MKDNKTNVLSTLSSFNTLLNDFPSLLTVDINQAGDSGNDTITTISFLLDIGNLFGITEKKLLDWISKLLTDDENNPVKKGLLTVVEESVKAALLLHFNSLYNCEASPIIPDDFLRYSYTANHSSNGGGAVVRLQSIDMFNQLRYYPLGNTGQMFYFDVNANSVNRSEWLYRSCDLNAWLWYVINLTNETNFKYTPWDDRVYYKGIFAGDDGDRNRINFVDTHVNDSQFFNVPNIGPKKHIFSARYVEHGSKLNNSNVLYVYGCAETYKGTGILGYNKTVFEFNADYIYSLKLFDSKTVVAQIINSLTGLSGALFGQLSLELNILVKKIEKTVDILISKPQTKETRGYFEFSDEEYNDIVNDATIRYNGEYESHNENNDLVSLDVTEITNAIKKIDEAQTSTEKEEAIKYSIKAIGDTTTEFNVGVNTPFTQQKDIITRFIKEIVTQIALNVLSPKVMLLFAINDYFLAEEGQSAKINIEGFMKDFWNIISSCVLKIADLLIQSLYDTIIGFIRPILVLIVEKLLLETLMYYKELLINLLANCVPFISFNVNSSNLVIDNVNYADIIPTQTVPEQ